MDTLISHAHASAALGRKETSGGGHVNVGCGSRKVTVLGGREDAAVQWSHGFPFLFILFMLGLDGVWTCSKRL